MQRMAKEQGDEPAARASLLRPPMRVVSRTLPTPPRPRATGGTVAVVGDASEFVTTLGGLGPHSGVDPPRSVGRAARRQPEERGPPVRPSAA
jgi:hypothetical protein